MKSKNQKEVVPNKNMVAFAVFIGIIAPLGFLILSLVLAQFIGLVGLGPYFPWAIPGVYTVPSGTEGMQLVYSSYIILFLTCIIGFYGTIAWWRFADHH